MAIKPGQRSNPTSCPAILKPGRRSNPAGVICRRARKNPPPAGKLRPAERRPLRRHLPPHRAENPAPLGGTGASAAGAAEQPDQQFTIQAGFAPLLLVWLLATPPSLPLEFTYAGQAKTQSGGQTADVLDLNGPHNFAARLFIDQRTHQVLML